MAYITFNIPLVLEIHCLPTAAGSSGTALESSSQPAAQRVYWWETLYIHCSMEQFLLHQAAASPLVTPFYCRIQKYAFMSISSSALNDDQDVCSATGEMAEEVGLFCWRRNFGHSHNCQQSGWRMSLLSNVSFSFLGKGFRKVFFWRGSGEKVPMRLRFEFFLSLFWQMFLLSPIAQYLAELLTADPRNAHLEFFF